MLNADKNNENTNQITHDNRLNEYIEQLSTLDKRIIKKGEEILKSSFNLERSIGFIEWKNHIEK